MMKFLFNRLIELYIIAYKRVERDLRGVLGKSDHLSIFDLKIDLKASDKVKSRDGTIGTVYKVYRDIKTNEIRACTIIWDSPYQGEPLTLLIGIEDLYPI